MRSHMRTFFFTVGLFSVAQGAVCLGLKSLTVTEAAAARIAPIADDAGVVPMPVWVGATLVAAGVITLLYAIALPAKRTA